MTQREGETWLCREAYSLACHIRLTLMHRRYNGLQDGGLSAECGNTIVATTIQLNFKVGGSTRLRKNQLSTAELR
jgi:hypothetical protein